jgi:hypothetical protein
MSGGLGWRTAVLAAFLAAAALVAIAVAPTGSDQTGALLTLGAGQLAVAWGLRTPRPRGWVKSLRSEPLLPLLLLAGAMLVSATLLAPVRQLLGTVSVGTSTWLVVAATALASLALTRLVRARSV